MANGSPSFSRTGKIAIKDMQEYFDLAYAQKQIAARINVAAVTDYTLLDQVAAGK